MQYQKVPFKELPLFNQLIKDYLNNSLTIDSEIPYPKVSFVKKNIRENKVNRSLLVNRLKEQNKDVLLSDFTKENIQLLSDNNSYTITTGHQLCLMTGPMYFINKIASVIALCEKLKKENPEKNFVPTFWMASEDHDFDEINHFHVFGKKYEWNNNENGAVGRMSTTGIDSIIYNLENNISTSVLGKVFLELMKKAYQKKTLAEATRLLVNELFKEYGLVIIDGDDIELKRTMIPFFKKEIIDNVAFEYVSKTNKILDSKGYKIQVNPREINLFYLKDQTRARIIYEEEKYKVINTKIEFSEVEILLELDNHPERFSPNVILRPVFQEVILPNLAYVGGGGEISYWLQLEKMFKAFDVTFPALFVRDSAVFLKKKTFSVLEKNQLTITDLFRSDSDLSKNVAQQDSSIDYYKYKNEINQIYAKLIEESDQSLKSVIEVEKTKANKGLTNIEKRTLKNLKEKNEVGIGRLIKAKKDLFPVGKLQERYVNYFELITTFDENLILKMIERMNPLNKEFHFFIADN